MGHHDLFFKKTFSIRENAADFLQHTLAPELVEEMDLDTLTIEKGAKNPGPRCYIPKCTESNPA